MLWCIIHLKLFPFVFSFEMFIMKTIRVATTGFVILVFSLFAQVAFAFDEAAVGIVLDVQGTGKIMEKGAPRKLQLLAYLKKSSQITLEEGAKASLSLYATRSTYRLTGPAVIEIDADKVTVTKGAPAVVKSMAEKLVVAAESSNLLTGAIRMRTLPPKIAVLSPESGAVLLNSQPTFTWMATEPAKFDFTLSEQAGNLIASEKLSTTEWSLPASISLKQGMVYRWTVSFLSEKDGNVSTAKGEFSVGSKEMMDRFGKLKPSEEASIEEWILYAATLQGNHMFHEARMAWQFIGKQRPDLEKVKEMAR
jgi:hypothetical protein